MAIKKIEGQDGTEYDIGCALANVDNADDLKAIEAITGTGYLQRTANNTWTVGDLNVTQIITSSTAPATSQTGDYWFKVLT